MTDTNTGGPAFPTGTWEYDGQNNVLPYQTGGMTLRDYFAAKAMQGFASTLTGTAPVLFEALAQDAYKMADAMLSARGTERAGMTDQELLELAAKAANIDVRLVKQRDTAVCEGDDYYEDLPENRWFFVRIGSSQKWNPLTDDGDALRLAVKLGIHIEFPVLPNRTSAFDCVESHSDDPYAATRRAIVRAAAEIGRNMK